ncbi:hypothetical protein ACHQM5_023444 [Ranunculus cassubicifolius]
MEILFYILVFLLSFILFKFLFPNKSKNLPPSIPSLPIIGHLYLFKKPLHKTLAFLSSIYGPVLYLKFGVRPVLVISSPSGVEECLTNKNDIIFANRPRLLMGKVLGHDYTTMLWAPYGPHWINLRRISAIHILSTNRIQTFADVRMHEVKCMIERLSRSQWEYRRVEMTAMVFELTLNNMMRMIAGKRYYGENMEEIAEAKQFKEIVKETLSCSGASDVGDFLPVLRWIGIKGFEKKVLRIKEIRDKFLQTLIDERRRLRNSASGEEQQNTLIDILLSLQETDPDYHTNEMIRGFIWIMFAAGTETSACTMEWAMSLLLNNPHVLIKAQEEIDNIIDKGRLIDESDINYQRNPSDCVVGGYNVPGCTMLLVNVWAIQNDPKLWDEPTVFKPERFESIGGTRDTFKFLPFGLGRRGCPGEGLAMHAIGLTLGALLQCFDWQRVGKEMVDMTYPLHIYTLTMTTGKGLTLPKAKSLDAMCRPRSNAISIISSM